MNMVESVKSLMSTLQTETSVFLPQTTCTYSQNRDQSQKNSQLVENESTNKNNVQKVGSVHSIS